MTDEILWKTSRHTAKNAINDTKSCYYNNLYEKFADPATASKQYWRIVKFLNGLEKARSILANICEVETHDKIFNTFCIDQTRLDVPTDHMLSPVVYSAEGRLSNIVITESDVKFILFKLDINKASGSNKIGNLI